MSDHDHNHEHETEPGHDHHSASDGTAGTLKSAIFLLLIALAIEVVAGIMSRSLALLADAGHVFMDMFGIAISLGAAVLARYPPNSIRTFGWHRAEILAAMINGVLLLGLSAGLFLAAWNRLADPGSIVTGTMFVAAVAGLIINIVIAVRLGMPHSHDLNMRSAYLHVLGDTGASVSVVVGALVIRYTGWTWLDSVLGAVIGTVIMFGAVRLILKAGHILIEGVPIGLSVKHVAEIIRLVPGVKDVHDLHIWTICSHIVSLSCHVVIDRGTHEEHDQIVKSIADTLWKKSCIMHSTIQVDYEACGGEIVGQDMHHRSNGDSHRQHSH